MRIGETPEEQRKRLHAKRLIETDHPLIKCLECELSFVRVGSHVVQIHGYETVLEYRREHGLMAKETRAPEYAKKMSSLATTIENLKKGASNQFKKGDGHAQAVSEFWNNRELRAGTRKRTL